MQTLRQVRKSELEKLAGEGGGGETHKNPRANSSITATFSFHESVVIRQITGIGMRKIRKSVAT